MSIEQAHALVERVLNDPEFAARLDSTPVEERRQILEAEGYGDVQLRHLSAALPHTAGGELTDEEFAAVAGGHNTVTVVTANVTWVTTCAAVLGAFAA